MLMRKYRIWGLLAIIMALSLLAGACAPTSVPAPLPAPSSSPAQTPTPIPAPTPPPAPSPTPTPPLPTPTLSTIPKEILASHFGIVDVVRQDIGEIARLGIRWDRPHPLPFVWGRIEPEKGKYRWRELDGYVQATQNLNFAILATIWPFAEWDQANWGGVSTTPVIFEEELGRGRRKPYDMDAYRRFVSALVERYDGDGKDDMPALRYPIKYWEASNEPSMRSGFHTFFNGSSEDYLEILKATYQAVEEADPEAKVLHAGMAGMDPSMVSFWEPIFEKGSQYFDIANIHSIEASDELNVPGFKKLLSKYGIDKPIWVTEAQHSVRIGLEEHGRIFARSYVIAFACGADRVFYTMFRVPPFVPAQHRQAALFDEGGERRPAYYALKTLISKLEAFTSAEKLAEGRYKFMVEGKAIYVLWGSGKIPEEITGEVLVTDIYGKELSTNISAINLTESPIFIEEHPH